jgi:hypothetical protein
VQEEHRRPAGRAVLVVDNAERPGINLLEHACRLKPYREGRKGRQGRREKSFTAKDPDQSRLPGAVERTRR